MQMRLVTIAHLPANIEHIPDWANGVGQKLMNALNLMSFSFVKANKLVSTGIANASEEGQTLQFGELSGPYFAAITRMQIFADKENITGGIEKSSGTIFID